VLQVSRTRAIAARVTRSARSKNKLRLSVARTREQRTVYCGSRAVVFRTLPGKGLASSDEEAAAAEAGLGLLHRRPAAKHAHARECLLQFIHVAS
jgi:hypothetical protein